MNYKNKEVYLNTFCLGVHFFLDTYSILPKSTDTSAPLSLPQFRERENHDRHFEPFSLSLSLRTGIYTIALVY